MLPFSLPRLFKGKYRQGTVQVPTCGRGLAYVTSPQNSTAFKNNQKASLQPGRKGGGGLDSREGKMGRGREETERRGALSVRSLSP